MKPEKTTSVFWNSGWFPWAMLGGIGIVYFYNMSPHPGFHDSLSFLCEAIDGFSPDTNATNHFLYCNILTLLVGILPFLSPVTILNVFSVICSLVALWQFYRLAYRFFEDRGVAALGMGILGLAFTWWQQSEITEVYAFSNAMFMVFFSLVLRDLTEGRRRLAGWAAFLLSILILIHIQHILAIPFFLWYIWWGRELKTGRKVLYSLLGLAGLGFLLLIPLLLNNHPVSAVFFDTQFGDDVLGLDWKGLLKGTLLGLGFLVYNFHIWLAFAVLGAVRLYRTDRRVFLSLALLFLPYLGFAVKYSVSDAHVFFLVFYIWVGLMAVGGAKAWLSSAVRKRFRVLAVLLCLSPLMYSSAVWFAKKYEPLRKYDQEKSYKGGLTHLLWPGKRQVPDPLDQAEQILNEKKPVLVEWNLEAAKCYLEWKKAR